MAEQIDRLLTQAEVVQITGLSSAYFEKARHAGNSTLVFCKIGRAVRYRMSDLQCWINEHLVSAKQT